MRFKAVSIVTGSRAAPIGFRFPVGARDFCFLQYALDGFWGLPCLLLNGYWGVFPQGSSSQGVNLTTPYLHLFLKLRMSAGIPLLSLYDTDRDIFGITFPKLYLVTGMEAAYFDDIWLFVLDLCGLWQASGRGFEPLVSMIGRGRFATWANLDTWRRTASWHWLLTWGVIITACIGTFSELRYHTLFISDGVAIRNCDSCFKWSITMHWAIRYDI